MVRLYAFLKPPCVGDDDAHVIVLYGDNHVD